MLTLGQMAHYKKADFARECGISPAALAVNITRKKVVVEADGYINSEHPMNADFLKRNQAKKREKAPQEPTAPPAPDPDKIARDAELKELLAVEKETKRLALESKRKEQALLDAKIQKMHGQLIPTDLVKILFAQHFREVSTTFKQGIDGILSEIGKKARLNGNQVAEIRGTMIKIINDCVNKGVDNSKKSIQNVVTEYQNVKKMA